MNADCKYAIGWYSTQLAIVIKYGLRATHVEEYVRGKFRRKGADPNPMIPNIPMNECIQEVRVDSI
jgi:hypothetical protein